MATLIFNKSARSNTDDKDNTVVAYSKAFLFRRVEIGGKNNQCLQFSLNAFYKDVGELKQATVLWNLVNWSKKLIQRCNDNAFIFNGMLGYNTVFYDLDTSHWYWDEVDSKSATCYIKYKKNISSIYSH